MKRIIVLKEALPSIIWKSFHLEWHSPLMLENHGFAFLIFLMCKISSTILEGGHLKSLISCSPFEKQQDHLCFIFLFTFNFLIRPEACCSRLAGDCASWKRRYFYLLFSNSSLSPKTDFWSIALPFIPLSHFSNFVSTYIFFKCIKCYPMTHLPNLASNKTQKRNR